MLRTRQKELNGKNLTITTKLSDKVGDYVKEQNLDQQVTDDIQYQ